ncbi:uncharacterized protein SPPG_03913 [Spizellomyces punctatus DAOM BR117]|uniref:Nudix hydrolase domain-containing protein n=1 Tax=Spizellomyces punctatus (strain DAOM BR117) TaxID=645134 RepID=A0A0L0HIT9_SPIPD|nr:uncharacterized protein SPPG_03913 [Spizellomyces punctatus DAOM BR117]KND00805.1 hypothetical protein SPPG_03913 [Spizellomyces punctatus DAOM BR117]|eukprot:XP_016608844.1 hypothetical protein SPPG_03913 [Spizellomyces punctatus DAOM BR117]
MPPPPIENLRRYTPPPDNFGRERRAAVLVPLIIEPSSDEIQVLLTLRSKNLRKHGGEVALPGGRHETDDVDLLATALREAEEEIGLSQDSVQCVTVLPPFLSRFHLLVTPVVGMVPSDFVPRPNPEEVAACFKVPLRRFLKDQAHRYLDVPWEGGIWRKHAFWWTDSVGDEYKIFGLTADIMIQVAVLAYDAKPEFQVDAPGQAEAEEIIKALDAKGKFGPPMARI